MTGKDARQGLRGTRIRRWSSRVGSALSPLGRRALQVALDRVLPIEDNVALADVGEVRRILLVRPNFRLGNALVTSPLIEALHARFPGAAIDYLGGEGTLGVLDHLQLDERIAMSRGFVARPWGFVALFVRLRRRRYDLAVEGAMGSFSGGLYTFLSGARHRMGVPRRNERFLDVRLPPTPVAHAYDGPVAFAAHLGVVCADRPAYVVAPAEARAATEILVGLGLHDRVTCAPYAVLFVGGHGRKRWPVARWAELATELHAAGGRLVICAGPEEVASIAALRAAIGPEVPVLEPQPIRTFAALLAAAALVVTPDSGPMHLAAAVGAPVVSVLASRGSTFFGPRGRHDVALVEPAVADVLRAVQAHDAWPSLVRHAPSADVRSAAV